MVTLRHGVAWAFLLAFIVGCSSTKVAEQDFHEGEKLPRPDRIIVHDFEADPAEVPPDSAFNRYKEGSDPLTPEEAEIADKLGAEIAQRLAAKLNDFGLPAVLASGQPAPLVNDVVVNGYFFSVYEGSASTRVVVGFGYGDAKLTTAAEAFQMTPEGLRRIGGSKVKSAGANSPGAGVPAAVAVATLNPIGLLVGGTVKLAGEATGSGSMDSAIDKHVNEIAEQIKAGAESQGWI